MEKTKTTHETRSPLYDKVTTSPETRPHVEPLSQSAGWGVPQVENPAGLEQLTAPELDVPWLIRNGHGNKQIADRLCIAETTVNFPIKNLVDKLQSNDRTHAVTIAVHRGLLQI
jgi:DNA-binding NarL/FixJ family response regulator